MYKTPYHLHLHMLWAVNGMGADVRPAYFFGISPDYVTAGAGVMGFDKVGLARFRDSVDAEPDAWLSEISALEAQHFDFRQPELKRVPAPYPKEHPAEELLRRKALAAWTQVSADALDAELIATFTTLTSLVRRLAAL